MKPNTIPTTAPWSIGSRSTRLNVDAKLLVRAIVPAPRFSMPFHFTCPYCFKKTLIEDSLAGQEGPCAGCGKLVKIPAAPPKPVAETKPVAATYVDVQPQRLRRRVVSRALQTLGLIVLVGCVSVIAAYLLWPTLEVLKVRRDKVACMNNLQKIALALNAYADEYGSYPPPAVLDEKGRPLHSWRVLILSELGYPGLYARYDFSQPWDSATNAALFATCPTEYVSPAVGDPSASESTYVLVTGQGTLFPKSGPLAPQDILDGPRNTLLVVEAKNTTHEWTKPIDIEFGKLNHQIGAAGPNTIGGDHTGGATAVFADGTPAWLPNDIDPVLIDSIITPRGGEPVDPADYQLN